jgi:hypothetical protein
MTLCHDGNRICSLMEKMQMPCMLVMLVNGILLNMVRLQQEWPPNLQDLVGSYYCYLPQQACTAPTCKLVDSYCHYTTRLHLTLLHAPWPLSTAHERNAQAHLDTYATISLQNDKLIFFSVCKTKIVALSADVFFLCHFILPFPLHIFYCPKC